MLRIKLVKSPIGNTSRNRATVKALGLRKVNQIVEHNDHPSIRGMIHKVKHLLSVEEVEGERTSAKSVPTANKGGLSKAAQPAEPRVAKGKAATSAAEEKPAKAKKGEQPEAEAKPAKKSSKKQEAADIAPDEPVEAGTEEQPPTEEPVGAGEKEG